MSVKQTDREIWIDSVKLCACVLVAVGHLLQSMVSSELISSNPFLTWLETTIYTFHVPLFFLCSGYLHQKNSRVKEFSAWGRHILKKLVTLGIPYIVFSVITWGMKVAFSDQVNFRAGSLSTALFASPMSPYWYLYVLFFVFLITPAFTKKWMAVVAMAMAVIMKGLSTLTDGFGVYALTKVMEYEVWFVLGMCFCRMNWPDIVQGSKIWPALGAVLACVFALLSVMDTFPGKALLMGLTACTAIVIFAICIHSAKKQSKFLAFMSRYTMPIFLMHTIFAAGFRIVLLQLGIRNGVIHIFVGLAVSFAGPILASRIMEKVKWLDIFLHPGKYIKLSK